MTADEFPETALDRAHYLDEAGYPTDTAIERIVGWDSADARRCLDFVARLWWSPDFGVTRTLTADERRVVLAEPEEEFLRLATGGWSGNEDLIHALRRNVAIHMQCWRLRAVGGLHIYRYPPRED